MSYSILYRSMFIKMSDGRFIPMMEMGDNNVWECNYGRGRNRRARSWSNIRLNKKQKFFTEEEIRNFLEGWNNEFEDKRQKDLNSDDEWIVYTENRCVEYWHESNIKKINERIDLSKLF